MAPKKKTKDKKSRVLKDETPEEQQARIDMERQQAVEQAQAASQKVFNTMREKHLREENYAKINQAKIVSQWRKIMRMAKVEQLKKYIEV